VATTDVLNGRAFCEGVFRLLIIPRNAFFTKGGASAHSTLVKLTSVHLWNEIFSTSWPHLSWAEARQSDAPAYVNRSAPIIPSNIVKFGRSDAPAYVNRSAPIIPSRIVKFGRMEKVAFKLKIETKLFFVTVVSPWMEWISKGESTGRIPFSSLRGRMKFFDAPVSRRKFIGIHATLRLMTGNRDFPLKNWQSQNHTR